MLMQHLLSSISVSGCPVYTSASDSHVLRVTIPDAAIQHPDDEHIMLEICRGLQ